MKQQGFSIVELLIALVLGLIIIGAALGGFMSTRETYAIQSELLRIQDNARYIVAEVQRSVRQAGFSGCSNRLTQDNVVKKTTALSAFTHDIRTIDGNNNSTETSSNGLATPEESDWLSVSYANTDRQCIVASHDPDTGVITCEGNNPFAQGELLVITDCRQTTVFQQSNQVDPDTPATLKQVHHQVSDAISPGNCQQALGSSCNEASEPYQFAPGSTVFAMQRERFLVAKNNFGQDTLYRQELAASSASLGIENNELISGIAGVQMVFGARNASGQIAYQPLNLVSNPENIIAMRLSLLLEGEKPDLAETQQLTFGGQSQTFNDGRLRQVYESHITLRNPQ